MKPDPLVHEPAFAEAISRAYGLPVARIAFLTTGWISYCFRVETASGEAYLLKAYDESEPAPVLATSREFYLPLSYQLCTRRLLPQIACPVPALDGGFSTHAGEYLLILFRFIDGTPVGFGDGNLPDDVLVKLAPLVGRLHMSTRDLELVDPLVEHFDIAYERLLPDGLDALARLGPGGRPARQAFRDLVLSHRSDILGYLERLKGLQAVMRSRTREMVVCHTDLHGGNLMVDGGGELYILDWEGAMLSPPEQDLFFFAGKDTFWDLFWPGYQRAFGPARLDLDTLGFYYYRRALEDLADWVRRMLYVDQDDEKDADSLHWTAVTLADLPNVETILAKIAARGGQYVR